MIYRIALLIILSMSLAQIPSKDIARINQDIFSATENNYQDLSIYFTDDAWGSFSKALIDSGNLAYVKKYHMTTIVTFLGVSEEINDHELFVVKSNIIVTHHNDDFYHTNEYTVTMSFVDENNFYKIKHIDIKMIGSAIEGLMMPQCALK